MNIEAMAREAGLQREGARWFSPGPDSIKDVEHAALERFASLVLEKAAAACKSLEVEAERQSGPEAAGWLEKAADAIQALAATKPGT